MKKRIILFVALTVIVLTLVFANSCNAQVRLSAGAGAVISENKPSLMGTFNAGYEVKNISFMFDMRSQHFKVPAWFGLTAGYNIPLEDETFIRPFAGYWFRKTGNKSAVDRYVSNGTTTILSTKKEIDVEGYDFGGGVQVSITKNIILDVSYIRQFQVQLLYTVSTK